jgi:hypothetical protein
MKLSGIGSCLKPVVDFASDSLCCWFRSTFEGCVSFENLIIRADAPGDLMVTVQFVALPAMPEEQPDSMPPVLELQMLINPGPQSLPNPRKKAPPKKK